VFSLLLLPTIFYDSIEIYVMDYSADKTTIVVMFFFQKTKIKEGAFINSSSTNGAIIQQGFKFSTLKLKDYL
jgi:hypothetical protein